MLLPAHRPGESQKSNSDDQQGGEPSAAAGGIYRHLSGRNAKQKREAFAIPQRRVQDCPESKRAGGGAFRYRDGNDLPPNSFPQIGCFPGCAGSDSGGEYRGGKNRDDRNSGPASDGEKYRKEGKTWQ